MTSYIEKLKDPRWQKKRLLIMQRDGFACVHCGTEKKTLNVHHKYYVKNKEPWEYEEDALETLCERCHKNKHEKKADFDLLMSAGVVDLDEVFGFAIGRYIATNQQGLSKEFLFKHANYSYVYGLASGVMLPENRHVDDLINFVSEKRAK